MFSSSSRLNPVEFRPFRSSSFFDQRSTSPPSRSHLEEGGDRVLLLLAEVDLLDVFEFRLREKARGNVGGGEHGQGLLLELLVVAQEELDEDVLDVLNVRVFLELLVEELDPDIPLLQRENLLSQRPIGRLLELLDLPAETLRNLLFLRLLLKPVPVQLVVGLLPPFLKEGI